MDECLPLGSLDAPALRMLLERERTRHVELAREIHRPQAGLDRQNGRIIQLEHDNAHLLRCQAEQRRMVTGLHDQNALLRQQVAQLEAENSTLGGHPAPQGASGRVAEPADQAGLRPTDPEETGRAA